MHASSHIFTKCSIVYCHTDNQELERLGEIFNSDRFDLSIPAENPAMLLALTISRKPTFAFMGSTGWDREIPDIALQLRKYAFQTRQIIQLPFYGQYLIPLLEANANGYLCPQATDEEMLQCFAEVLEGNVTCAAACAGY